MAVYFHAIIFKAKGSRLANQATVGLNFGELNTKYRNRIND